MAATLPKFSMVLTADASQVKEATAQVRADLAAVGQAADQTSGQFARHSQALDNDAAAARRASDASRLMVEQEQRAQAEVRRAMGISSPANNNSSSNRNHNATNTMFQFQDILMTAAGGMDAKMIALQQGSQLAGGFAGMSMKEAAATTGTALMGLVSPISIATIGLTALTATAIQYGIGAIGSFDKANDALEKHDDYLKQIRDTYKSAAAAGEEYGQRTQTAIAFSVNQDRRGLEGALDSGLRDFAYRATPAVDASQMLYAGADMAGLSQQMGRDQYGVYADAVARFAEEARSGKGDVFAFNEEVKSIANSDPGNKRLQDKAKEILAMATAATQAADRLKELRQAERELTLTMSRTDAANASQRYQSENEAALRSLQQERAVGLAEVAARSPTEVAAAARSRAALEPVNPNESPAVRNYKIEQAGVLSLAQIGVTGSGSQVATSFLNWGSSVDPSQVMRGDVLVKDRGLSAGALGGHVGLATGQSRTTDGALQLQMLSGNSGDAVQTDWVNASALQVRRATEAATSLGNVANSANSANGSIGSLGSGLNTAAQGLGSLGTGLNSFGSQVAQIASGGGASPGGGFFGNLLGSLGGAFGGVSPTSPLWAPNTTLGNLLVNGYDDGGYTGHGGVKDPAGVVHRGEIVWSQRDIARAGGVPTVEAMRLGRRGYDNGGYVSSAASFYSGVAAGNTGGIANDNRGSSGRELPSINVYVDNPRGDRDIEDAIDRGVTRGIKQYDKNFNARLERAERRKLVRNQH